MKKRCYVFAILALIVLLSGCGAKTIDMQEFAQVNFEGLNENGHATVDIDYAGMENYAFGGSGDIERGLKLELALEYEVSQSSELSNGDEVTVVFSLTDSVAKDLNLKLKNETLTYVVDGLREAQKIDPFEDIEVTFSGIAPHGYVEVVNNSEDEFLQTITYIQPIGDLSNGDTVEIQANYNSSKAEEYGYIITRDTAEYIVEGLPSYITSLNEIDNKSMAQMESESINAVTEYFQSKSGSEIYMALTSDFIFSTDEYTCGEPGLEDIILLTTKENTWSWYENELYVICSLPVKIHKPASYTSDEVSLEETVYVAVHYCDLIKGTDGNITPDPENGLMSDFYVASISMDLDELYAQIMNDEYTVEFLNK